MKKTGKITLSAILAALASAFLMASFFPYLTYGIPALAGLFIMVVVIEAGVKWGFAAYFVSAALALILPGDPEAKLLYIAFFGYYPALKAVLENKFGRVAEYVLKFLLFNASVLVSYGVIAKLLSIDIGDMGEFGKYTAVILLAMANVVFIIYDIMVARMAAWYSARLHKTVSRYFNK